MAVDTQQPLRRPNDFSENQTTTADKDQATKSTKKRSISSRTEQPLCQMHWKKQLRMYSVFSRQEKPCAFRQVNPCARRKGKPCAESQEQLFDRP